MLSSSMPRPLAPAFDASGLRAELARRNLTVKQLAEAGGLSYGTVRMSASGYINPGAKICEGIAQALDELGIDRSVAFGPSERKQAES